MLMVRALKMGVLATNALARAMKCSPAPVAFTEFHVQNDQTLEYSNLQLCETLAL